VNGSGDLTVIRCSLAARWWIFLSVSGGLCVLVVYQRREPNFARCGEVYGWLWGTFAPCRVSATWTPLLYAVKVFLAPRHVSVTWTSSLLVVKSWLANVYAHWQPSLLFEAGCGFVVLLLGAVVFVYGAIGKLFFLVAPLMSSSVLRNDAFDVAQGFCVALFSSRVSPWPRGAISPDVSLVLLGFRYVLNGWSGSLQGMRPFR
jgi:hypothetical protein